MIPSTQKILSLHKKYAPNKAVFKLIYLHSQIVWEIAKSIIKNKNLNVDNNFIQVATLLHDIGAYGLIDSNKEFNEKNYIKHGIQGYKILKKEGIDHQICEIARRHTGVGITKEQIKERSLPLPINDYIARTREERLIMYADKFHSKTPRFNSFDSYLIYVRRFGEWNVNKFQELADEFGIPKLEDLAKKYNQPII